MREGTAERRQQLYREAMELITHEYMSELDLDGVARRLATSRRERLEPTTRCRRA